MVVERGRIGLFHMDAKSSSRAFKLSTRQIRIERQGFLNVVSREERLPPKKWAERNVVPVNEAKLGERELC